MIIEESTHVVTCVMCGKQALANRHVCLEHFNPDRARPGESARARWDGLYGLGPHAEDAVDEEERRWS